MASSDAVTNAAPKNSCPLECREHEAKGLGPKMGDCRWGQAEEGLEVQMPLGWQELVLPAPASACLLPYATPHPRDYQSLHP